LNILVSGFITAGMLTLSAASANAALDDAKAQDLLKKGGCTACHSVDKKIVGPAYKDVAAKHKGEADAVAKLEKVVRSGGKGTYGTMPMPPNPVAKISDADLHELVEWVLSR
jgi:cytochrome c